MIRQTPVKLYDLLDIQIYILQHYFRFIAIPAARRSRKTLLGKRFLLNQALMNANNYYTYAAPTYGQAKNVFWNDLFKDTRLFAKKVNLSELKIELKNNTTIQVIGLDNAERSEGSPLDGIVITEFGNTKQEIWQEHIRPMLSDRNGWGFLEGTPEGRNHWYNLILKNLNYKIPKPQKFGSYKIVDEFAYFHWFTSAVLPQKEIDQARKDLDERTFRQEYEGSFESYQGLLYYNFKDKLITNKAFYEPTKSILLFCDFNKSPLVWTLAQLLPTQLKLVDEFVMENNAKTIILIDKLIKQLQKHRFKHITIYGDASGTVETTKDFTTDYIIMKNRLEKAGWEVDIQVPTRNPNINNRVNLICSLFDNNAIIINPKCHRAILDYQNVTGDGKGGKDKQNPVLTHSSDGIDYGAWELNKENFFGIENYQLLGE